MYSCELLGGGPSGGIGGPGLLSMSSVRMDAVGPVGKQVCVWGGRDPFTIFPLPAKSNRLYADGGDHDADADLTVPPSLHYAPMQQKAYQYAGRNANNHDLTIIYRHTLSH